MGKKVLVVDRRAHIGGNAYDHYDAAGVLGQSTGPTIFQHIAAKCSNTCPDSRSGAVPSPRPSTGGWAARAIPINLDNRQHPLWLSLNANQLTSSFAEQAERRESVK